jgi:hypothetical protein
LKAILFSSRPQNTRPENGDFDSAATERPIVKKLTEAAFTCEARSTLGAKAIVAISANAQATKTSVDKDETLVPRWRKTDGISRRATTRPAA